MAKQFTYDQLATISAINGFQRADQKEIVKILSEKMREIYGSDIDLSPASADAQYLMMESLILDNIYNVLGSIANNLNPNTASGQYLDILCRLTNIERKQATQSKVNIYIKNVSGNQLTITTNDQIEIQDTNNYIWTFKPESNITLNDGEIILKTFKCTEFGPIFAYGTGQYISDPTTDIDWNSLTFTENNGSFKLITYGLYKIYQSTDAIPGNIKESDTSLRLRQKRMQNINSYTTKEGLFSALYNLEYIDDCYIYNNNTNSSQWPDSMQDIQVGANKVYIALRYKPNVVIDENEIASIINNRLTPGVITQDATGTTTGIAKTKTLDDNIIYWKQCSPQNDTINIKYMCLSKYNYNTLNDGVHNYVLSATGSNSLEWTYDDGSGVIYTSLNPEVGDHTYSDSSLTTATAHDIEEVNYYKDLDQETYIKTTLLNYLNNIQIGEKIINNDVITQLQQSDLNQTSFITQSMTINTLEPNGENFAILPVTYFNYTSCIFSYTYDASNNVICELIIS